LPVQPVTESPYSSIVGIPTIIAAGTSQEGINVAWGYIIAIDEGFKTTLVELSSAGRSALPSGIKEFVNEIVRRGQSGRPCRSRTCDTLIKSNGVSKLGVEGGEIACLAL
jgi:hypothetical protein